MKNKDYFEKNNIAFTQFKMDTIIPLGNSVVIVCEEHPEKIVAVHRKEDPNQVCFPGGKQELSESSVEAAIRETYEETGIKISEDKLVPIFSGVCESQKNRYWVTTYFTVLPYDTVFNSPEPEMRPTWMNKEEFLSRSAYKEYNKEVLERVALFI